MDSKYHAELKTSLLAEKYSVKLADVLVFVTIHDIIILIIISCYDPCERDRYRFLEVWEVPYSSVGFFKVHFLNVLQYYGSKKLLHTILYFDSIYVRDRKSVV